MTGAAVLVTYCAVPRAGCAALAIISAKHTPGTGVFRTDSAYARTNSSAPVFGADEFNGNINQK
jgi:hypothetical protein